MKRLFVVLLLLSVAVYVGLQLQADPGNLLISTQTWTIETPLWVACLIAVISFIVLHMLCLFLHASLRLPIRIHGWRQSRKHKRARDKTQQGLIEFSEGYWKAAEKHLMHALPYADIPLFHYLTAARAAQEQNQTQLRDHYLRQAQQMEPKAKIAVKLTQAQLQIASQQWEQALATLQHLHDVAPKHPYVLKLLAQLSETLKDWSRLFTLLPALKKSGVLPPHQFEALQQRVYLAHFQQICQSATSLESLHTTYKSLPKAAQQDPLCLMPYCRALAQYHDWQTANQLLKRYFKTQMNDALLALYTELPAEENKLDFVKTLLQQYPHSATLHFCLGRLHFQARLFGQARYHFEQSLAIHPTPTTYFYLGSTLEMLGEEAGAYQLFKQGNQLSGEIPRYAQD